MYNLEKQYKNKVKYEADGDRVMLLTQEQYITIRKSRPCFLYNWFGPKNFKQTAWVMIRPNQNESLSLTNYKVVQRRHVFAELHNNEFDNKLKKGRKKGSTLDKKHKANISKTMTGKKRGPYKKKNIDKTPNIKYN